MMNCFHTLLALLQPLRPCVTAGLRLSARLYGGGTDKMDYNLVPTTVFTPLEYGCIGMAEELAVETYGADNIEVYQSFFKPLEWTVNHEVGRCSLTPG